MKRTAAQLRKLRTKFWWTLGITAMAWLVGGLLFGYAFSGGGAGSSPQGLGIAAAVGGLLGTISIVIAAVAILGIVATSILVAIRGRQAPTQTQ